MTSIKPKDVIIFLQKKGRVVVHVKGSHHVLKDPVGWKRTIIALHNYDLPDGTLHAILKQTGYSKKDIL